MNKYQIQSDIYHMAQAIRAKEAQGIDCSDDRVTLDILFNDLHAVTGYEKCEFIFIAWPKSDQRIPVDLSIQTYSPEKARWEVAEIYSEDYLIGDIRYCGLISKGVK